MTLAVTTLVGSALLTGSAAGATRPRRLAAHAQDRPAAVKRAHDLMQKKFPNVDAGVLLTRGEVVVRVAGNAQSAVRSALDQAGLGATTTVVRAQHSISELKALTLRISKDVKEGLVDKSHLVGWGPDTTTNKVLVYLDQNDPTTVHQLLARYGADSVKVSSQLRARPHRTSDRDHDTAPYYGGDSLWVHGDPIETDCTSGFDVIGRRNRKTYMLTAGHCADVGEYIDTNEGAPRTMGPVTNKRFVYGGLDEETIGGNYHPYVWRYGGNYATVIGDGEVPPHEGSYSLVTVNGAVTGEQRKLAVVDRGWCELFDDGQKTCYLQIVSGFAAADGDSGGPVYQYSSNGLPQVFVAGTIVGSDFSDTYFQQILDIENWFNVDVATG